VCPCAAIIIVVVVTLVLYLIIGLVWRKWIGRDRYRKKLAFVGFLVLVALPLSYGFRQWPFYLAAELATAALGLTAGWCWIDYDRRKINGPLDLYEDVDQLGYFNSRVAMRSADLFHVTIADIPKKEEDKRKGERKEREKDDKDKETYAQRQRDIAYLLVQRYWRIALKITQCVATPSNVTVYFSQPADEAGKPNKANYKLQREKEPEKEPEEGKGKGTNAGGETQSSDRESNGKKTDGKKEYETVGIASAAPGPIRSSVVLNLAAPLPVGTVLRITVKNLKFNVPVNELKSEEVELLPPNNAYSFKVISKVGPDGEEEDLKKVLQPAYAIGMKIITPDQYTALKNEFFAQSELCLGLIVPLILVVLGLALIPQVGLGPAGGVLHSLTWFVICAFLAPMCMLLFVVGAERFHKFRMEVKLLILGNWQSQKDAKKKQNKKDKEKKKKDGKDPTSSKIQDALADAIKNARAPELRVNLDAKGPAASS
jgi:hypothetical protein